MHWWVVSLRGISINGIGTRFWLVVSSRSLGYYRVTINYFTASLRIRGCLNDDHSGGHSGGYGGSTTVLHHRCCRRRWQKILSRKFLQVHSDIGCRIAASAFGLLNDEKLSRLGRISEAFRRGRRRVVGGAKSAVFHQGPRNRRRRCTVVWNKQE